MHGDLKQALVPELILQLYLYRRSGVLRLHRGDEKKNIYFMDGEIVFAHSNQKEDRLGETLLRLGKITQEEFELSSREVIDRGKRLGQALQDLGFLSADEVNSGVRYQLQQVVFSLFDWDGGSYNFLDRERPVYEDIMVDISTPNLILEGIRQTQDPSLPARSFGNDENCVLLLNEGVGKIARKEFDFGEETLLACVDGKKDVAALRSLTRLSRGEFNRAACSLIVSGVLMASGDATRAVVVEDAAENPPDEARIRDEIRKRWAVTTEQEEKPRRSGLHTHSESEIRQMILDTEAKFHSSTNEEILNVFPDSSEKEIQKAYDHLTGLFHPMYYSQARFLDLKDRLKFILDKLSEAHDHLMHRAGSLLPLETVPLSQASEDDLLPPLPVEARDESQDLYHEIHPLTPDEELGHLHEEAGRVEEPYTPGIEARLQEPHVTEVEPRRSQELPSCDSEKVAEIPVAQREGTKELSPSADDMDQLQRKLKNDPANADLLRSIGFRMLKSGKAVDAEKQFIRALEIEPQNVVNHFALAELYESQGLRLKAFKHLNVILQLEPKNQRAREMLGVEKRRKPLYEISSKTKKNN